MGYVYKITNTVNGKAYIGISIHEPAQGRIKYHLSGHGNQCIASAVKKYGQGAFVYEILEADVFDEILPDLEVAYIAKLNTIVPHGYNLTRGGDGAGPWLEQKRRKIPGKRFNRYKIGAVAYLFITEPDKTVKEIAVEVGVREHTVHKWRAKGEWDKALDAFDFTGDRSLRRKASRDLERESGDVIDLAKSTYRDARAAGMNKETPPSTPPKSSMFPKKRYSTGASGSDGIKSKTPEAYQTPGVLFASLHILRFGNRYHI